MPVYTVYVKSIKDRVRLAVALRAFKPTLSLADALVLARSPVIAKDLESPNYLQQLIGDAAELHVESRMTEYESVQHVYQEKMTREKAEEDRAWTWYHDLASGDQKKIKALIRSHLKDPIILD